MYYADGSGGRFSSDPRVRRCGWGAVKLDTVTCACPGGFWGTLPGQAQTVPRAELFAIWFVLKATNTDVTIYTDCALAVLGFNAPAKTKISVNSDIWHDIWTNPWSNHWSTFLGQLLGQMLGLMLGKIPSKFLVY